MTHIEIHWLETATDASRIAAAGLPRVDLAVTKCTGCDARVGEVNGLGETIVWKACGIVLNGERIGYICRRCFAGVDKSLKAK